jgi:hypothetical protein
VASKSAMREPHLEPLLRRASTLSKLMEDVRRVDPQALGEYGSTGMQRQQTLCFLSMVRRQLRQLCFQVRHSFAAS